MTRYPSHIKTVKKELYPASKAQEELCSCIKLDENTVAEIPGTAGSISGETKGIYEKTVYAWR